MTSKPAPPESARRALSGGAGLEVIGQPQRENEAGVPDPENDHLKKKTQYMIIKNREGNIPADNGDSYGASRLRGFRLPAGGSHRK